MSNDPPGRAPREIDLSCDLGEAATLEENEVEQELWPLISSANIACGGHAGDEETMRRAAIAAKVHGVRAGAHPSYPDREHFGRRSIAIGPGELRASLLEQLTSLRVVLEREGLVLSHVKPHGALYNDVHANAVLADTVVEAIASFDSSIAVVASSLSQLCRSARSCGMAVREEAFADRRYRADGSLVPRSEAGALLLDPEEASEQALRLVLSSTVMASDGSIIDVPFQTLCVHGDMENAVERVRRIRAKLTANGIAVG